MAIFCGIILATIRVYLGFTVEPQHATLFDIYKDVAHLYMGGLFVAWRIQKKRYQFWLFWMMCLLEVAVATLSRI
jgi:hypothetical protein